MDPSERLTKTKSTPPLPAEPDRRILITGGAGFLGVNAAVHLIKDGWHVTLLDNLSRPGTERNLKWVITRYPNRVTFVKEDVRNAVGIPGDDPLEVPLDRKSTRLNSSHSQISYAVFCLKKKKRCLSCRVPSLPRLGDVTFTGPSARNDLRSCPSVSDDDLVPPCGLHRSAATVYCRSVR